MIARAPTAPPVNPNASIDSVSIALIAAFNGIKLSDGSTLTASDKIQDPTAISDAQVPFLAFKTGAFMASEWNRWVQIVDLTIPATLMVKTDRATLGVKAMRAALDDLFRVTALIKGLPVDANGLVVPYTTDTPRLIDEGAIGELIDRTGPTLKSGRVTEAPGPYITAEVQWFAEFYVELDPRKLKPVQVVAIGVNTLDPLRLDVPANFAPGSPTPAADVQAIGRFGTPDPSIQVGGREVPRRFPPFPVGGERSVSGADPSTQLASVLALPYSATVSHLAGTQQATAIAYFLDGSTQDVTAIATWASSDATKATVNSAGLVTGVAIGSATITATWLGTQSSALAVTVT